MGLMDILRIAQEGITHPFGDERSVKQAFPAGIDTTAADPFLMCDYFHSKEDKGLADVDEFPVDWHPHRGFDICSYLRSGTGRHGDSLGNRETFETPGMQWMSTGSGVVHAEGGGNEKGQVVQGFQIWINCPAERKMDDPRYGTVPTQDLPLVDVAPGVTARVLAGHAFQNITGPFATSQEVQMIDLELQAGSTTGCLDLISEGLDTAMLYIYEGTMATVNNKEESAIQSGQIVLFDASSDENRGMELVASKEEGAKALLFAGKKLKEPIVWHGPIVMNTQSQIQETIRELRKGTFPPVRVKWDYKRLATKPKGESETAST
ncbi:Pirin-like protein [Seminavis robusta]|uniref:Pirin-like protein n=1 Tax=Seminavis robusta TaxID=568900 RepID=A0A9N8HN25_9STRA|nr:Pirin-like protein [Seminavis robusta]|eukprot:Sro1049_g235320.1 Pirin-like protein (321) ;mRNA; f:4989-5951